MKIIIILSYVNIIYCYDITNENRHDDISSINQLIITMQIYVLIHIKQYYVNLKLYAISLNRNNTIIIVLVPLLCYKYYRTRNIFAFFFA